MATITPSYATQEPAIVGNLFKLCANYDIYIWKSETIKQQTKYKYVNKTTCVYEMRILRRVKICTLDFQTTAHTHHCYTHGYTLQTYTTQTQPSHSQQQQNKKFFLS